MFEHEYQREVLRYLARIEHLLELIAPKKFSLKLENSMANGVTAGSTGTWTATLLLNGQPYVAPDGSTYEFAPTFTSSDADVTLAPEPVSGTTDEVVATVPAGSADTSLTVSVSVVAPDGTTLNQSSTVPVLPAQVFSLGLVQTA